MRNLLLSLAIFLPIISHASAPSAEEYMAIVRFMKNEVEWSFTDPYTLQRELVVLDEPSLVINPVLGSTTQFSAEADVINFDEDYGPEYGTVSCTIILKETQFGLSAVRPQSKCLCNASFICGEREGRLFE